MKYIIPNCLANNPFWGCRGDKKLKRHCKDIPDCVIKRIVNECREQNLKYDTTACSVLELLEIEECK